MACWTNHEIRKLEEMHRDRRPTGKELAAAFPRHSKGSIFTTAQKRGFRKLAPNKWMLIANRYLANPLVFPPSGS